jgi:LysR family transcriptional regulator, transcriptional activator of the cysJI operon
MDISHLSAFCTVVEAGSISRAAKDLYVTQPAISQKIQELEDFYQVQLLERNNKGIRPTDTGLYLYSEAQKVIALMSNIQRELEAIRNPSEELAVGASSTIGNFALPCTMFAFRERYPGYSVTIDIGSTEEIISKTLSRRVEIGLVEGPLKKTWIEQLTTENIAIKKIAQTKLILVAKYAGKYADHDSITFEKLKKLPFITREVGSGIRSSTESVFASKGIAIDSFDLVHELNTINSIISAVTSDMGVTLLPAMALRKELRYKIVKPIKVINAQFRHDLNLLYQNNSRKKSYTAFVELIDSKDRGFC